MSLLARLSALSALILAMLTPVAALAEPSLIYLVRHGDKTLEGKDPELAPQGQQRARNIAAMLGSDWHQKHAALFSSGLGRGN